MINTARRQLGIATGPGAAVVDISSHREASPQRRRAIIRNYSDRRDFLKLTAAGAATLTLGGLTVSAGADEKRTLTVAWDTDIDPLDPASFKSIGGYTIQANIYDSPLMWKVEPV